MRSKFIEPPEAHAMENIVKDLFRQRNEIIDAFVKTFLVTELRDYEHFSTGSLELIEERKVMGLQVNTSFKCEFIPYDERKKKRDKLLEQIAIQDILKQSLQESRTEELIAELKRRGLGVFNLSLPFVYRPKHEN